MTTVHHCPLCGTQGLFVEDHNHRCIICNAAIVEEVHVLPWMRQDNGHSHSHMYLCSRCADRHASDMVPQFLQGCLAR